MKITLKQGELIGATKKTIPNSKTFHCFLGIPYAEPPVGGSRFQAPVPHKGWHGVLDATKVGSSCLQKTTHIFPTEFGSEDCLFLNVYVPETTSKRLKPVFVWVHGGNFSGGMGELYEPDYLMEYDVIFVTFNYRLHVFGFLNLGLAECPGNVGLRDQILLFKWVRENIEAFGGDSTNVTAGGTCAGASSVHLLNISPLGKGLFDKAILQSGCALSPWIMANNPVEGAFELGRRLGFQTADKRELLKFLKTVPAMDLLKAARRISGATFRGLYVSDHIFMPSVEFNDNSAMSVLPEEPIILMRASTPVPTIIGMADNDSLIKGSEDFSEIVLQIMKGTHPLRNAINLHKDEVARIVKEITRFYFNGKIPAENTTPEIIDLRSDCAYGYPIYKTYEYILENYPEVETYLYRFSYEGSLNYYKIQNKNIAKEGTAHGDELFYLFTVRALMDITPPDKELQMIHNLCTLWTNFIKYGSPSSSNFPIKWNPASTKNYCYLHIDSKIEMKNGIINEKRMKFLDQVAVEKQIYSVRVKM